MFGFVGMVALFILFVVLLWRFIRVIEISKDSFGQCLAAAIFMMVLFQSFVNIGMNIGILPVTGITLPFISQGLVIGLGAADRPGVAAECPDAAPQTRVSARLTRLDVKRHLVELRFRIARSRPRRAGRLVGTVTCAQSADAGDPPRRSPDRGQSLGRRSRIHLVAECPRRQLAAIPAGGAATICS